MIYLDNAATTLPDPEVSEIMSTVMHHFFGNPSSSHDPGAEAKTLLEESRNTIAGLLKCKPQEIIFTSGGTEAINLIFFNISRKPEIKNIITSQLEHPAVLHSLDHYGLAEKTEFVNILQDATPDLNHLEALLKTLPGAFVSLMHVNNECGSMLNLEDVSTLCRKYGALFFCDTVQSIGKHFVDFETINLDFAACSAHKFHGPRGIGFLYKNHHHHFIPQTVGGGQENGLRSGTENTPAIAGLCKALELAYTNLPDTILRMKELKFRLINKLQENIPDIEFVGNIDTSLGNILSIAIPDDMYPDNLTELLNTSGFAISSGSACHAVSKKSTLLYTIGLKNHTPLRVSFGRFTTAKEIDEFAAAITEIITQRI